MSFGSIGLDEIWIVESLSEGDLRTGRKLEEDLSPLALMEGVSLAIRLKVVSTKEELLSLIEEARELAIQDNIIVGFQIEAHGSPDAVVLTSETVSWEDLKTPFTDLNAAQNHNLWIGSSLCYGIDLGRVFKTPKAPVAAVLSPRKQPHSAGDLLRFYQRFYSEWIQNDFIAAAKTVMNEPNFHLYWTLKVFYDSLAQIYANHYSQEFREQFLVSNGIDPNTVDENVFQEAFERFYHRYLHYDPNKPNPGVPKYRHEWVVDPTNLERFIENQ